MGFGAMEALWRIGWGAVGVLLLLWAWRGLERLWWRPRMLERALRAQGLRGTRYRFLCGDLKENARLSKEARAKLMPLSHDIIPRVAPFLHRVMKENGKMSFTWFGHHPRVAIMDPGLTREILSNKFGHFEKPNSHPLVKLLVGGLASYEGEKWAKHRRIINPAFHLEKLKCMLPAFSACCDELIDKWDRLVASKGSCELDVWPEFQSFTGDVISRTAFGSNFREGQRIFHLQDEQAELLISAAQNIYIPGFRSMIERREVAIRKGGANNEDLLGLLMESNFRHSKENEGGSKNSGMSIEDVIEECKLFYFAGHETTSVLLTWTLVVLSLHPSWQARAREEVLQFFGENKPDYDGLSRLKIVMMVLYEVLRLYPPAVLLVRKTYKEMKLGQFTFPEGVQLLLPIIFIHHDPEFWGEDASEFNPERFAEGVSKASKIQGAFFPFGGGPRICIGQSFAMMEAKMALSRILQHFTFQLSPSYAHAPYTVATIHPQHGAQIILHRQ
ncbi:cytochrome P450 72A15-like isoform X2 [Phoenix dactylifera]|uniref:Cytochrome P450 72A15-like isoform X2 n=1 Tax=Phoenix dactylifera TaxID=42345 RepID=A0A8B9A4E3_PHODC|nr:cytochrome P450 72A15-like isoform X2 [Phoenix dactylifera]